jgi:hypothetical protein
MLKGLAAAFRRVWAAMKACWNAPKICLQHQWLVGKELGAVIFATRVPTLVVALVFVLLSCTEPAQDMLSEAALDVYVASPTTLPFFRWYRLAAMIATLIFLAASAWYWSRVVLMYHRAMPDLVDNEEGQYRSTWRPALVLWWPRILGTAVFVGSVLGLAGAIIQYANLKAQEQVFWLSFCTLMVAILGAIFLRFLIVRRRYIPVSAAHWALAGASDARAPYHRVLQIFDIHADAAPRMRYIGNAFLLTTLFGTVFLLIFAGNWPVTLGDGLGGLAVAQLAAAIAIPWFTLLTIAGATNRLPYFGLAAMTVLLVPTLNGCFFDRIDNHDVRTIAGAALPERWTMDEVYDKWFAEKQNAQTILYSSTCQMRDDHRAGECRSEAAVKACREDSKCRFWKERPPFIVIAAEGGASRAGYWTALSVGEMLRQDPDMRDSIFAISSVSGGTLGAVLIRALIDLDRLQDKKLGLPPEKRVTCSSAFEPDPKPYLSCARVFMRRDFLASAFAGMFYTDLLQRFIPSGILPLPDRAATIERSWEESWEDVISTLLHTDDAALKDSARKLFGKGFLAAWGKDSRTLGSPDVIKPWPVLLLNGTNVETGRRVITSNVDAVAPASRSASPRDHDVAKAQLPCVAALSRYGSEPDIIARLRGCSIWEEPAVDDPFTTLEVDMPISTAVNMSARFPIVQPAGGIALKSGRRAYHVVDGGIYENFGAQTINDLLRHFLIVRVQADINAHVRANSERDWETYAPIRPMVVLISTDHDLDGVRQVAPAYGGKDDRVDGRMGGKRNDAAERVMRLGCNARNSKADVPLCEPKLMKSANEVLGDAAALYRTRSGRGESGILSLRETLASTSFYDENFFHLRQCLNGTLRPASMTWYVSGISRIFMSELLPSVWFSKTDHDLTKVNFEESMKYVRDHPHTDRQEVDACQNHAELKRLIDRYDRIRKGER